MAGDIGLDLCRALKLPDREHSVGILHGMIGLILAEEQKSGIDGESQQRKHDRQPEHRLNRRGAILILPKPFQVWKACHVFSVVS